jgi:hypothetical protein
MKRLRRFRALALLLFAFIPSTASDAQPASSPAAPVQRTLDATSFGSPIDLSGPWLFHMGNDPAWAAPGLDDNQWLRVSKDIPLRKYGFPDPESCWYRIHLRLRPDAHHLALDVHGLAGNFALFANGLLVGQNGGVTPGSAVTQNTSLAPISIPDPLVAASHGDLVLAFRVYTGPIVKFLPGPIYKNTVITLNTPEGVRTAVSFRLSHSFVPKLSVGELDAIVGLCALFLFVALRSQPEYLALAIWMLANAVSAVLLVWMDVHPNSVLGPGSWLNTVVEAASIIAQIEFVRIITRTRRTRPLVALEIVIAAALFPIPFALTGQLPLNLGFAAAILPQIVSDIVLPILLLRSALRKNLDALLILVPFVIWAIEDFYNVIGLFTFTLTHKELPPWPNVHLYSYAISLTSLFDVLGLLCLLLIILTRTTRLARERADLAAEVQAAEEVQALLLARAARPTPGYFVETAYRPAGEVGGDFFLVSPDPQDGSLLVIVGDVSGKGMGAAMRVSLILGVLNREQMRQPELILSELNQALLSQGQIGFTTACCVRLERDGAFIFSNAGHLNPYVDGLELASPGSLPLGLTTSPEFEAIRGILRPGERMILLSDGVLEARSGKGDLLGFDRLVHITRMTASEIADTAQRFGQNDDITVLSLSLA